MEVGSWRMRIDDEMRLGSEPEVQVHGCLHQVPTAQR